MLALVTGASSGIGAEAARYLSSLGYDLIITARRTERLEKLKRELKTRVTVYTADLSNAEECKRLFEAFPDIDILINNAGFGVFGRLSETDLDRELEMLDVNIRACHILMKLYLKRFKERNSGYILNVASSAAFFPGPLFSSYYASKAYVYRLSRAAAYELKREKSKVVVSVLCPGPVSTEFNEVAGVRFAVGSVTGEYTAKYAIDRMLKRKTVTVPSLTIKLMRILSKLVPDSAALPVVYRIQSEKNKQL